MTADQMIGATINAVSAITAIVSTRVYHGLRPVGSVVPCINFYRLAGSVRTHGFDTATYSINCRAVTAATALHAARLVVDLFQGTSGMGTYGGLTGFEVTRASLRQDQGLIPETEDGLYNAPVDVQVVYPTSSVT
jgi:hypothetical protein